MRPSFSRMAFTSASPSSATARFIRSCSAVASHGPYLTTRADMSWVGGMLDVHTQAHASIKDAVRCP